MKKILALAALAAVMWAGVAGAQQQDRYIAYEKQVYTGYKQLSVWFPVASQVQGSLNFIYTGDAEVVATDTVRLFLKSSSRDTADATRIAVISKDVFHANTAMGSKGSGVLDTLCVRFTPAAGANSVRWTLPLPVFIYPGEYVSVWGARDSTNGSSAAINIWHVGTPIR